MHSKLHNTQKYLSISLHVHDNELGKPMHTRKYTIFIK